MVVHRRQCKGGSRQVRLYRLGGIGTRVFDVWGQPGVGGEVGEDRRLDV